MAHKKVTDQEWVALDAVRFSTTDVAVFRNANRDKIHNPNLIYPGQIFVMPEKKTP